MHQPSSMTTYDFRNALGTIFGLLESYLPSWATFDYFSDTYQGDGYQYLAPCTLSTVAGSTTVTGHSTHWNTPMGSYAGAVNNIVPNGIIAFFDDNGNWQRIRVQSVISDTSLIATAPASSNATLVPFWVQGFFLGAPNLNIAGLTI
jgi:hypothetical protein